MVVIPQNGDVMTKEEKDSSRPKHRNPFRHAVLSGLGVVLPPLLTIVFLLWMLNSVRTYVLDPIVDLAETVVVSQVWDVLDERPEGAVVVNQDRHTNQVTAVRLGNKVYWRIPSDEWIPAEVYDRVRSNPSKDLPMTAREFYRRDVETRFFRPIFIVPLLLSLFTLLLYLLGKIIAVRVGRALWNYFERLIHHLPIISTVYATVKKVTDIVFADNELEFNRVVAVEYPRKGMWSVGFVTGESLPDITAAAAEPVLSVLMPTSPMPATGFTISVRKSETVELNITVDQAFQFVVSCGVVVPGLTPQAASVTASRIAAQVRQMAQPDRPAIPHVAADAPPVADTTLDS